MSTERTTQSAEIVPIELTDTERRSLRDRALWSQSGPLFAAVEHIIAARLAEVERRVAAGPSCGSRERDHDGCYLQDALRAIRTRPGLSGDDE